MKTVANELEDDISSAFDVRQRYCAYDRFAPVYDEHLAHFANRLMPVIERLMLKMVPAESWLLDLCCGPGRLAQSLAARGYRVTGLDGSRQMLSLAARNAPAARFVLDDARSFDFSARFDGVVSTFDSLNHILSLPELSTVFANVYRALRPGGMFLFDMNMEQGFRLRWWGTFRTLRRGRLWTVRATYFAERKLGENRVVVLDANHEACERFSFLERCYPESQIRSALDAAGFAAICVYDAHRDLGLFGEIGRSVFVCRKPAASSPCNAQTRVTRASRTAELGGQLG